MEDFERKVRNFLEDPRFENKYRDRISDCIGNGSFRLIINLNDVRESFSSDEVNTFLSRPREFMLAIQSQAMLIAKDINPSNEKVLDTKEIQAGFEGSFGRNAVSPRGLRSDLLNQLVDVEGIVTKCSNVNPKIVRSVHFCPANGDYTQREFRDQTSLDVWLDQGNNKTTRVPSSAVMPTKDADGNELELEQGFSVYKDYQSIIVQEMPERARVGQLPRSINVLLENDLVDRVKAGDRVKVIGLYRPLTDSNQGNGPQMSALFKTVLVSNNISIIGKEVGGVQITPTDIGNIRDLSSRSDILDIMGRSLCPSIFGHEFIKKALILQLLGGIEKNLENGTHIRGDINVLLVGDPSTAKSQLLRSIMDIAPLAISTTGRGSSGVGLTAAVTSDAETGERRLEAGAMVLADRGIVCVDEFDKMSENDRVAIHEVMEQQTVTIAKAGIHASLNARCSVLAAANPVYGQYDKSRRPQENIGLPDSLLSRFDLLFIVLDQLDPDVDRRLSEHVIRSHQYRRPGSGMEPEPLNQGSGLSLCLEEDSSSATSAPVWLRGGKTVDVATSKGAKANKDVRPNDIFTKDFLKKYIFYCKNNVNPVLSDVAMEVISSAYANMRSKQTRRNLPITARSLETIIRLATASAKCRLSQTVEEQDAETALDLINFVMFHEIGKDMVLESKRLRDPSNDNLDEDISAARSNTYVRPGGNSGSSSSSSGNGNGSSSKSPRHDNNTEEDDNPSFVKGGRKYNQVMECLNKLNQSSASGTISFSQLRSKLNESSGVGRYGPTELRAMLEELERDNKIMVIDEDISVI